jgi:membrane protein involved in D-alanine export
MTPYGSFTFFFIIAILLAPTVILGLLGKRFHTYNMVVTVIALCLIFSSNHCQAVALIIFTIWQVVLIKAYIAYRKKANSTAISCGNRFDSPIGCCEINALFYKCKPGYISWNFVFNL